MDVADELSAKHRGQEQWGNGAGNDSGHLWRGAKLGQQWGKPGARDGITRTGSWHGTGALGDLTSRKGSRFIADDLCVDRIPAVSSHADVTDAYLVALAKTHGLRLATLDEVLCAKPWARGVAENPLAREPGLPSTIGVKSCRV
jgi:hypothetical protein